MPELKKCPRCGNDWVPAISYNGTPSEFWFKCSNKKCNTYYNSYKPLPHQAAFHTDSHRLTANFGGFG